MTLAAPRLEKARLRRTEETHPRIDTIMAAPGPFPPLKNVREVREFDGNSDNLSDFITSVEAVIAAYNLPVQQAGYVRGDVDEGWTFVNVTDATGNRATVRSNINYGTRFCTLLAERLTGNAREWWIASRETQSTPPKCWTKPDQAGYCDVTVSLVSFKSLIEEQFGNPLEQEMAIAQLDSLSWDREKETLNMFRSRISSLFIKARISSWILQRGYILRAFNTSMRERLLQPASADELWRLAYDIIVTDDSIKTTNQRQRT